MENDFKATTVLDLLSHAANTSPSKTYCKSADHEFTYQNFIAACIKLSKKISNKKSLPQKYQPKSSIHASAFIRDGRKKRIRQNQQLQSLGR